MTMRTVETGFLGRVGYEEGLRLQEERVAAVREERAPEALFLLEHDPVLTLGRNAKRENVTAAPALLERLGIEVHECGRGGDVTYHGPGQLVGYPILNLSPDRKDVWRYVRDLEEAVIRTVATFGVEGTRFQRLTGVWVGEKKLCAIGVRISRWVTSHGFALNVTTNLDHFKTIVPCGIRDYGVTSLQQLLPDPPTVEEVADAFLPHFLDVYEREATPLAAVPSPEVPA